MYICVTHVDSITRVPCTDAPMANGPDYPALNRLVVEWWDQSDWPTATPKYYGRCADDSATDTPGVLEVLTAAEYEKRKRDEMYARKPYPSWVWNEETLTWSAPVPQPWPGDEWDESDGEWVMTEQSRESRVVYYKQRLAETDYVGLADYDKDQPEIKAERQVWRDKIRELEQTPQLLNVNTATKAELTALSGVGPAMAQAIIDGRAWASINDLTNISGISQSMVDKWGVTT